MTPGVEGLFKGQHYLCGNITPLIDVLCRPLLSFRNNEEALI